MSRPGYQRPDPTRNRRHVAARKAVTSCAQCGGKPIEYHHPDHHLNPHRRVSYMSGGNWSIEEIDAEIDRCTPLCNACHQRETTRLRQHARGSRSGKAKLTEQDVQIIRVLLRIGCEQKEIAERYGVAANTISNIVTGRTWIHVHLCDVAGAA